MTLLSVVQQAALYCGVEQPSAVMTATDRDYVEMREIAQSVAEDIAAAHDWSRLTTLHTMTGDGTTTAFALPSDFDRLHRGAQMWTSRLQQPLRPIGTMDEWLELLIRMPDSVLGIWARFAGSINIRPAPESTETVKYYYQTKNIVLASDATTTKAAFTADADTYRIDERILKQGVIARFREMKGLEYMGQLGDYNRLLEEAIVDDIGATMFAIGAPRPPRGIRRAYPASLS